MLEMQFDHGGAFGGKMPQFVHRWRELQVRPQASGGVCFAATYVCGCGCSTCSWRGGSSMCANSREIRRCKMPSCLTRRGVNRMYTEIAFYNHEPASRPTLTLRFRRESVIWFGGQYCLSGASGSTDKSKRKQQFRHPLTLLESATASCKSWKTKSFGWHKSNPRFLHPQLLKRHLRVDAVNLRQNHLQSPRVGILVPIYFSSSNFCKTLYDRCCCALKHIFRHRAIRVAEWTSFARQHAHSLLKFPVTTVQSTLAWTIIK